jgi:hypothetical protein
MSERYPSSANKSHAGMKAMNEAADIAIAQNERERVIESRASSSEVSLLNDTAELEIFGSRGRTYTDPKTGEVIATADRPMKGKIDEILSNPKYGKTEAERQEAAEEYQDHLEHLLNKGMELSQAKLVLDMEDPYEERERFGKAIGLRLAAGESYEEASKKVLAQMTKANELREKRILENGVFSKEDYDAVKSGKDLYPDGYKPASPEAPTPADPDKKDDPTEEEKRLARVAQLRGMSTDDLKKMYAAAYGEKAAEEITDLEELRKLDDEELLRLDARASEEQAKRNADEAEAAKGRVKEVKEYWEKGRKQDLYNRLIDVYRGADKEELKEILIAVYGEEAVLNPAKQKRKRTGWQKISPLAPKGGMNIKAMTKVDDQEALDLMYDAVKGGYRPDVNEISESEVAFMLAEMNAEAITAEDSLTSEQKRNRDILHHFNNLDDDQMIELMRTMHGEEMVVDNSGKTLQRKIARLRGMSDEEKTTYLRTAVDEKNFKLIAETAPQADPEQQAGGYEKNERNQWLINYYREIANNDPKELANLLRKVAGRRSYNKGYKSGEMTVESARLYNDASVLDIMESALDKKYKFVTPMPDFDATSAPISDQPRPQGRVASPNRRPGMRDADVDADEVVSSPADGSATEVIDTSDPRTEPIPIVVQPQPRKTLTQRMRDRLRNRGENPDRGNAVAGIARTALGSVTNTYRNGRERIRRNNEDQTDQRQRRTS